MTTTTLDVVRKRGQTAIWTDTAGVTHEADGADMEYPFSAPLWLLWTACGSADIPANTAMVADDTHEVSCPACLRRKDAA